MNKNVNKVINTLNYKYLFPICYLHFDFACSGFDHTGLGREKDEASRDTGDGRMGGIWYNWNQ